MALYNGNISETYWKSSSDNVLRKYGYSYDGLNRLNASLYMKPMTSQQRGMDLGSYNEHITYDKNGNINTLFRNGDLDSNLDVIVIDDLEYTYDSGNKLLKVIDNSNHPEGFKDGANSGNDYVYDDFGNMTQDLNKGINSITYNHLNLPKKITYSTSSQNISYLYNALGVKVQKKVFKSGIVGTFNPDHTVTTDYLSGFHYEFNDNPNIASSGGLKFFATSEGYVNVTTNRSVSYNYVYNYTDHLGNVRVSYTSGTGGVAIIMEENHYYPFGLKHKKYGSTVKNFVEIEDGDGYYVGVEIVPLGARKTYQYKYNGKEFQDELGLNMYDFGFRNYSPDLGRWMNPDLLAELAYDLTPYRYSFNNPIRYIDVLGLWEETSDGYTTNKKEDIERFFSYLDIEQNILNNNPNTEQMSTFIQGEMSDRGLGSLSDGSILLNGFSMTGYKKTGGGYNYYADKDSFNNFWHDVQRTLTPDALDTRTVGQNLLGLTYPGGNNPKTYSGKYDYSYVPSSLAEYPAIGHDRRYDRLGVSGASGLLGDTRAIGADWRFVGQELAIATMPLPIKTKIQAGVLGVGLGLAALPKTIAHFGNPSNGGIGAVLFWDSVSGKGVNNTPSP